MKNEDLFVYKKSDFYEDDISSQKEYYEREQVDTLLAEKDREIALLKERICNGDVSRLTWIDDCIAKDKEIAELKDKCQMHDFFWEGCGFAKRGFKNTIAVSEAFDKLEAKNAELKAKLKSVQASMYADVVDANMENRRLKRALWLARAERAKEHVWHDVNTDGSPRDDYKGRDWVLVTLKENEVGINTIPRIAEYRRHLHRWVFLDEDYDEISYQFRYLREQCVVIGWREIDFAYFEKDFFVQQKINKNVERKCRTKAEEYK